jgi:hypothetical protein
MSSACFWLVPSLAGMKPATPEELISQNKELEEEGMLFVGDKGRILCGFRGEYPQLVADSTSRRPNDGGRQSGWSARDAAWIAAFKGGPPSYGDFLRAGPICDAVNLASISLRLGGRRLLWDSTTAMITNIHEANRLLTRDYRPGWELKKEI